MQRERWSKILQSDYGGIPDRAPGMPILQSHGNLVSRGDLITQDNISAQGVWTVTINKDNFSQLCTVGNPGQLISYNCSIINDGYGQHYSNITGSVTKDYYGIYCNNAGSGTDYHGPVFYTQLPSVIGMSGQYWHIVFSYTAQNPTNALLYIGLRVGFSHEYVYADSWDDWSKGHARIINFYNSTTSNMRMNLYAGETTTITYKFYHYANNTYKAYENGTLKYSGADPIQLYTGNNMLTTHIAQYDTYTVPYHRIQQITVSTDPSYDPQP